MQNQVIATIEVEDQKIEYYSSVVIRQQFNAHHEFTIRIKYDVLETSRSFSLSNAQKMIGKSAIIKLNNADTAEAAYEFRGLICEICMEQSDNFTSDLVLKGFSPTILLENGPDLNSFYKKNLKDIVQQLTQTVTQNNYNVKLSPQYTSPITYICQYRESSFHFLNRLSSDFGEWFFYDGKEVVFGKPSSSPSVDITYGEDVHDIQLKLRILPMNFSSYSYVSKDDKVITSKAPSGVDGLNEYASFALKESNKIFSEPVNYPLRQRVDNKGDLDKFLKKQKAAMAANLEVLTGSSDNPAVCIGAIANVKFSRLEDNSFVKEDYGKFLITEVEHHVTENGKYYNSFEAIPAGMEIIPVKNVTIPIAEPQIATVTDNKDPDNMGRVRVQMLWQQPIDQQTDFIRVSTPDAGGGKDGAKNRGLVVIPEPGDQVLICFRYNDPDRPFIMGSMFHGKTGSGGGTGNNTKSLTSKSGHNVSLDDGKGISIIDKTGGNKVVVDGTNTVTVSSSLKIIMNNGTSTLTMDADKVTVTNGQSSMAMVGDTITLKAAHVEIDASADAKMHSGPASFSALSGGNADIKGTNCLLDGTSESKVNGNAKVTINSPGEIDIKGAVIKKNS